MITLILRFNKRLSMMFSFIWLYLFKRLSMMFSFIWLYLFKVLLKRYRYCQISKWMNFVFKKYNKRYNKKRVCWWIDLSSKFPLIRVYGMTGWMKRMSMSHLPLYIENWASKHHFLFLVQWYCHYFICIISWLTINFN